MSKPTIGLAVCFLALPYLRADNKCYMIHNATNGTPRIDFLYPNNQVPINGITWFDLLPGAQRQFCYATGLSATAIIGLNSGFMWQGFTPTAAGFWLVMGSIPFAATPGTYNIVIPPKPIPKPNPASPPPSTPLAAGPWISMQAWKAGGCHGNPILSKYEVNGVSYPGGDLICRVSYKGNTHLGRVTSAFELNPREACSIGYAGTEVRIASFEVLCLAQGSLDYAWGIVPNWTWTNVQDGGVENGVTQYVCEFPIQTGTNPTYYYRAGKVIASGKCNVGIDGQEVQSDPGNYAVLFMNKATAPYPFCGRDCPDLPKQTPINIMTMTRWIHAEYLEVSKPAAPLCLDVPNANFNRGTILEVSACNQGESQMFTFETPGESQLRIHGFCVGAANSGQNGSSIILSDCNGSDGQKWVHRRNIVNHDGQCLKISLNSPSISGTVSLTPTCGPSAARWAVGLGDSYNNTFNSAGKKRK